MNQQALSEALDRTIVRVANTELKRLSYGMSRSQRNEKIQHTLEAFRLLQQGVPPDYHDPWVALFYALWYQPGQIQLARLMIDKLREQRGTKSLISHDHRGLRLVDFGCGTLAMQFAVSISASDIAEDGTFLAPIYIDSYDDSSAMMEIGKTLWEQFRIESERDSRLSALSVISHLIESRYSTGMYLSLSDELAEERWLSGIHTVYSTNVQKIKDHLTLLVKSVNPHVGLLTCHADLDSLNHLKQASPFEDDFFDGQEHLLFP